MNNKIALVAILAVAGLVAGNIFASHRNSTCSTCPRQKKSCKTQATKPCVRMVPEYECAKTCCKTTCHQVCPSGYGWSDGDMNEKKMMDDQEMPMHQNKSTY